MIKKPYYCKIIKIIKNKFKVNLLFLLFLLFMGHLDIRYI